MHLFVYLSADQIYKNPCKASSYSIMKKNVKILDTCGDFGEKNEVEVNEILDWANGVVILYDICNRSTYNTAVKAINLIKRRRRSCTLPISLIGNKKDLEVGRRVSLEEGSSLAAQSAANFIEVYYFYYITLCYTFI